MKLPQEVLPSLERLERNKLSVSTYSCNRFHFSRFYSLIWGLNLTFLPKPATAFLT